jgi:hypothetical protein
MTAKVHKFSREGFIIGKAHCRAPGPEAHLMCFGPAGHEGGHQWDDWRGCRVRLPEGDFTVPFGGFAG